jgi:GNAT superfamily N-acetyltransferase
MSSPVEVRQARADEIDVVREIVEQAYLPYVERIGRRPAPMDDDYVVRIRDGLVDVVDHHDEILGLVVLVEEEHALLVENLAVRPASQGQGIGRALLAHAERTAVRIGLVELRLYTNSAMTENLELYSRLGWHEVDRRTEDGFQRVFFTKPAHGETS